jgi:hypothetical protein
MPDGRVARSDDVQANFRKLFAQERTDELDQLPLHEEGSIEHLLTHLKRAEEILAQTSRAYQEGMDIWSAWLNWRPAIQFLKAT